MFRYETGESIIRRQIERAEARKIMTAVESRVESNLMFQNSPKYDDTRNVSRLWYVALRKPLSVEDEYLEVPQIQSRKPMTYKAAMLAAKRKYGKHKVITVKTF